MTGPLNSVCHMAVDRAGQFEPCHKPAVATVEDLEFGEFFPVCRDHLTPPAGPIAGQRDIFGGEA